jgi:tetratricopeptide (TPR) repeat protein
MCLNRLRQILFIGAIFTASQFASTPAHAWAVPESITQVEWNSWPPICQANRFINSRQVSISMPRNRPLPPLTEQERIWSKKYGMWHFCTGYIWLLRAEATPDPEKRKAYLNREVIGDLNYVPRQIGPDHPLSPLVDTAYARALHLIGEREKALAILSDLKNHHQKVPMIYTLYAGIYFDQEQYQKAIDVLKAGNQATNDSVPELLYFLGVAYFKIGDIENARIYETKARDGGFPLRYLTRKLAEHDEKKQRASE